MLATLSMSCANDPQTDGESSQEEVAVTQSPLAASFALAVVPTGSHCPPGTWTSDIAPDGMSSTTAFSAYEFQVSPRTASSPGEEKGEAECKLTFTFNPTSDVQYSVGEFAYSGYAYLEPGVKARIVTAYKFSNTPERIREHSELAAPNNEEAYDQDFLIRDDIPLPAGEWTKCRKKEVLNIKTRLVLKNPMARKSAYINMAAVDGLFTVRTRPCTP
jgi:hypothetical protein